MKIDPPREGLPSRRTTVSLEFSNTPLRDVSVALHGGEGDPGAKAMDGVRELREHNARLELELDTCRGVLADLQHALVEDDRMQVAACITQLEVVLGADRQLMAMVRGRAA